jgi:hypothetical protein
MANHDAATKHFGNWHTTEPKKKTVKQNICIAAAQYQLRKEPAAVAVAL